MPDDNLETEVTEQEEIAEGDSEAMAAFLEEDEPSEGSTSEEVEKPEKIEEETEEPKEEAEEETETPEEDSEEEGETESEEDIEDVDEDEKRGEELLAKRKSQAEEDERKAEEAENQERAEEERAAASKPITIDTVRVFSEFAPDTVIPDGVIDVDGKKIDLKGYLEDSPESRIISGLVAKGIIDRLIKNGVLVSNAQINNFREELSTQRFLDRLTNPVNGVENAVEIYNDPKFQEWRDKASDKIQALFESNDWKDHVCGFKRFLNDSGKAEAEEKGKKIDEDRKERKEKADAIYKTAGSKKKKIAKPSKQIDGEAIAMEAFLEED